MLAWSLTHSSQSWSLRDIFFSIMQRGADCSMSSAANRKVGSCDPKVVFSGDLTAVRIPWPEMWFMKQEVQKKLSTAPPAKIRLRH